MHIKCFPQCFFFFLLIKSKKKNLVCVEMFPRTCLFEAQVGCVGAWKKLFYSLEFHKEKLSAICHGPNGLIGDSKVDNVI